MFSLKIFSLTHSPSCTAQRLPDHEGVPSLVRVASFPFCSLYLTLPSTVRNRLCPWLFSYNNAFSKEKLMCFISVFPQMTNIACICLMIYYISIYAHKCIYVSISIYYIVDHKISSILELKTTQVFPL